LLKNTEENIQTKELGGQWGGNLKLRRGGGGGGDSERWAKLLGSLSRGGRPTEEKRGGRHENRGGDGRMRYRGDPSVLYEGRVEDHHLIEL